MKKKCILFPICLHMWDFFCNFAPDWRRKETLVNYEKDILYFGGNAAGRMREAE
jgi:hypothetical protein